MYFPYSFFKNNINLNKSLISYYKLENNGNDELNNHNLNNVGVPLYNSGKVGNALHCIIHSTNYLSIPSHTDFQLTGDKTFALWVNSTAAATNVEIFASKANAGADFDYFLFNLNPNFPIYQLYFNSTAGTLIAGGSNSFQPNVWNLVIFWIDTSSKIVSIQTNNSIPEILDYSSSDIVTSTADFSLGANPVYISNTNDVQVDQVGLWNRILSTEEREYLWNNGNGIFYPFN